MVLKFNGCACKMIWSSDDNELKLYDIKLDLIKSKTCKLKQKLAKLTMHNTHAGKNIIDNRYTKK